jgi:hypothetical protein
MPISYGTWQVYPWKNELATQSERVAIHYSELSDDDFKGEHNPLDMLDRAIVLSGFAIRRMFEKRLVTDKLRKVEIDVRTFSTKHQETFRSPYVSDSGGMAFQNYNFEVAEMKPLKIADLASEIIHASQLMFVDKERMISTGLLVASDWHLRHRLLHITIDEFTAVVKLVLDDFVRSTRDEWDHEKGTVRATRE